MLKYKTFDNEDYFIVQVVMLRSFKHEIAQENYRDGVDSIFELLY